MFSKLNQYKPIQDSAPRTTEMICFQHKSAIQE
jgi:hypothetical protein